MTENNESQTISSIQLWDYPSQHTGPAFDEVLGRQGKAPLGWQQILSHFESIPLQEIHRLQNQILRLFHRNGILFNAFEEKNSHLRPWNLDLIPHCLHETEWKTIEEGLRQRATLLNLILQDLYGPMKMVEEGLIPAEIIATASGFLRACHGVLSLQERYLHLYAADIGRLSDGSFCVLGDRLQSLLGVGYALENRIILSRILSTPFQKSHVYRLASTFQGFRDHLASMAPAHKDNPNIVVLSPGPQSADYFEHSYLARYLGYPLVLGEDLSYREDHIYLKTLLGLQPVDVVLRFVDDVLTDPLELEGSVFQGVTGLLQAWRLHHVAIVNVPGAGLMENPAFMSFLSPLCERLLGEPLKIPSVPTFWLGQEKNLQNVLNRLDDYVIKPVEKWKGHTSLYPDSISSGDLERLLERIQAEPHSYIAQQKVALSRGPVFSTKYLEARSLSLRAFVFATGDSYQVMPGGLARFSSSITESIVSDRRGGGCKDTWVLSDNPVPAFSLLPQPSTNSEILRTGGDVVSRVADNLFWLGRYVERTHFQSRLLRSFLLLQVDESIFAQASLEVVLRDAVSCMIHPLPSLNSLTSSNDDLQTLEISSQDLLTLLKNSADKTTFAGMLSSLYVAAQAVRDRLSNDAWRIFIQIHESLDQVKTLQNPSCDEVLEFLDRLILMLASFDGLASESMSRGQGWRFLEMGKRLERVLGILGLIRHMILRPLTDEATVLQSFLEIMEGIITYRRRYPAQIEFTSVFDLILCDESNPQSLAYQLRVISDHIHSLNKRNKNGLNLEQRLILESLTKVRLTDVQSLEKKDESGLRTHLAEYISDLESNARKLYEALNDRYLVHSQIRQKPQRSKLI